MNRTAKALEFGEDARSRGRSSNVVAVTKETRLKKSHRL